LTEHRILHFSNARSRGRLFQQMAVLCREWELLPVAARRLAEWLTQQRAAMDLVAKIAANRTASDGARGSRRPGSSSSPSPSISSAPPVRLLEPRAAFSGRVPLEMSVVPLKSRVAKRQHGFMGLSKAGLFEKDVEVPYEHGE
jgi:hypothetical protein